MSLVLTLLGSFLLAGQVVKKWNAPAIALMAGWIAVVVGVHIFILR